MTILEKSAKATAYYEGLRKKHVYSGFEKFVATDGVMCMFVTSAYEPENDDILVFYLSSYNKNTSCQLHKPKMKV